VSCAAEEVVYNIHTCAVLVHSAAAAAVTWVRHVQRAGGVNGDGPAVRRCPTMLPLRKCSLLLILIAIITSLPVGEGNYCDDHVCLSVCLSASISPELHVRSSPNFYACYLCPWVGPSLAAVRYFKYFRFYG